jgi:hypothetical protein
MELNGLKVEGEEKRVVGCEEVGKIKFAATSATSFVDIG